VYNVRITRHLENIWHYRGIDEGHETMTQTKLAFNQINGQVVSVLDYGADPTGAADSTAAFNDLNTYISTITDSVDVYIPEGVYVVDPLQTTTPLGSSNACLIDLVSDGSRVFGPGQIKIKSSTDYTAPFSVGDEEFWSVVLMSANDCTVDGVRFDGNGKNTSEGYNASIVNIRFQMAASFGTAMLYLAGNKVINCQGVDFGGQAVAFQFQSAPVIAFNRFNNHSGIGVSVGEKIVIQGNTLRTCYDAPIYVNGNIQGAKILGNFTNGTTNGSACDVVGAYDVEVANNYFRGAFGAGLWVHYSSQQANGSDRVHIHHNTFYNNAGYTSTPVVGEIVIGRQSNTPNSANNVTVEDNIIYMDGSAAATAGRPFVTQYGVNNLKISRNKIYGIANSSNIFSLFEYDLAGLEFSDNEWLGSSTTQGLSFGSGITVSGLIIKDNAGIENPLTTNVIQNTGYLSEGALCFQKYKNIGTTAENIIDIDWLAGAYEHMLIEVTAVQIGEFRGVTKNQITLKGNSGVTPTTVANTTEVTQGNNPPVITLTQSTGNTLVKLASVGAAADTNVYIKIYARLDNFTVEF
jgi:hypothetical protein